MKIKSKLAIISILSLAVLASCGGNGSSKTSTNPSSTNGSDISQTTNTPTSTSTTTPTSTTTTTDTSSTPKQDTVMTLDELKEKVATFSTLSASSFKFSNKDGSTSEVTRKSNEILVNRVSSSGIKSSEFTGYYESSKEAYYNVSATLNSSTNKLSSLYGNSYTIGDKDDEELEVITLDSIKSKLAEKKSAINYNLGKCMNQYLLGYFNSKTLVFIEDTFEYEKSTNTYYVDAYDEGYSTMQYYRETYSFQFDAEDQLISAMLSTKKASKTTAGAWDETNHKPNGTVTPELFEFSKISYAEETISQSAPTLLGYSLGDLTIKQGLLTKDNTSIVNYKDSTSIGVGDNLEVKLSDDLFCLRKSYIDIKASSDTKIVNYVDNRWTALAKGTTTITVGTSKYTSLISIEITVTEKTYTVDFFNAMYSDGNYTLTTDSNGQQVLTSTAASGIDGSFELEAGTNDDYSKKLYAPYATGFVDSLTVVTFDNMGDPKSAPTGYEFSFSVKDSIQSSGNQAIFLTIKVAANAVSTATSTSFSIVTQSKQSISLYDFTISLTK